MNGVKWILGKSRGCKWLLFPIFIRLLTILKTLKVELKNFNKAFLNKKMNSFNHKKKNKKKMIEEVIPKKRVNFQVLMLLLTENHLVP